MSVTDNSGAWTGHSASTSPDWVPVKLPAQAFGWEIALVATWFFVTAFQLPMVTPLRYLTVLVFAIATFVKFGELQSYVRHYWFLFLYAGWALLSFLWSPVPSTAMRFGAFLVLEVFVLVYIATRLSPHQIIKAMFYACLILAPFAFIYLGSINSVVIPPGFGEKNGLANRMFFVFASCLYVLFTPKANMIEKGLALLYAPIAFYIIILAESATSLVLAILAAVFMGMIGTFWRAVSRVRSLPVLMIISVVALVGFGVLIAMSMFSEGPVDAFLGAVGKDSTLTGRTELWEHAQRLIRENPYFGLGAEGFWLPNRGDAQSLLEYFYKAVYVRFSFHNSYLEIAVQLGLVGLFFFLVGEAFVLWRIVLNWFRSQDLDTSFFLMIGLLVLARSMTESDLYNPMNLNKMMMFLGGMTMLSYRTGWAPAELVEKHRAQAEQGG